MTFKNFMYKGVLMIAVLALIGWLGKYLYLVDGEIDWFRLMLVYGVPVGIPYMFFIIPARWDLSGTIGVVALCAIIGAVFGFIIAIGIAIRAVWYVIVFPISCLLRKGEKQDMSTGENIKRIRKFRGMTQKELGIAIGIGEESASPRMAQYETDNRTPRKEMLNKMAVVLDVDPRNISIPTGYREEDMIYRLLVLEDYFPEMKLERNLQTGDVAINFHNKKLNEFLFTWGVIRGKRAKGLISEEEYREWKYKLQK